MRVGALTVAVAVQVVLQAAAAHAEVDPNDVRKGFVAIEAWRVDEARDIAERLYREAPEDALVLALVAEVKLHMSDYAGAVAYYARAKKAGAPEMTLRNASLAEAARVATQGYAEHVGDNFILRFAPGKDAVLVPYAMETLDKAMERIGELLGWRPKSRVVMEFYPSAATLAAVSTLTEKDIENSGTIALCKWNRLMATSPRGVVFGYGWRDTIAHELTHLIIGGASKNTVPIWLHEGIAKFAETAWRGEPGLALSIESQESLRAAAKKGELIPFEKMHPSMAKLPTQEQTALAFAEVFTFIEFLVDKKGWPAIRKVLQLMSEGMNDVQAIESVFGAKFATLEKQWKATLPTRKIRREGKATEREVVIKKRADTPDDKLHGLNKKARRFARAADLLYARGRLKAAQKELEKAYGVTKSPLLAAKLANVALAAGDLDAAAKSAQTAIDGIPDLPGPHLTLAEVLVRKDRAAEARKPLDAALAVNPFDPRIHSLLLASYGNDEAFVEQRKQAQLALLILERPSWGRLPILGTGGLVEVDAVPFSRLFIIKRVDDRDVVVPTAMVTPTAPVALPPGALQIKLVPPQGEVIIRPIEVKPTGDDGLPQRIAPDMQGS